MTIKDYPEVIRLKVKNGTVIVAGDAHYQPGPTPLMHRALVAVCKRVKPDAFVFNGDIIDASTISRHARIAWERRTDLAEEIRVSQDRLREIEQAIGKAPKTWNRGNHDDRFETRLSNTVSEYAGVQGMRLADHFPSWPITTATWINNSVVIKHRFKGGKMAPLNNTQLAGKTIITGHLHSAMVVPYDDYNGTRWGVDHGCLINPHSPIFRYSEGNPKNWREGFVVLTFKDGKVLQPELVLRWDSKTIQFRGNLIRI